MNTGPLVLHMDDDPNDRLLVEVAARRAGLRWDLRSVPDGDAAIAYLKGEGIYRDRAAHPTPELVLLDLKLPRKSGFEVLEWIRREGPHGTTTVVLTSSAHEKDVTQAKHLGASDYYVKPVSLRQLETLITQIAAKWTPGAVAPEAAARL